MDGLGYWAALYLKKGVDAVPSCMQEGRPLDFANPIVQTQLDGSLDLFRQNEFVAPGTVNSWWEELKGNGTAPRVRMHALLYMHAL